MTQRSIPVWVLDLAKLSLSQVQVWKHPFVALSVNSQVSGLD